MHRSLFIASPKPLDKDGWSDLLLWADYEIAEAIDDADYAELVAGEIISADDLKSYKYLTTENKDENNILVTISTENRQKCRNWKANAYRKYADDIEAGNRCFQNMFDVDAIEYDADFFMLYNAGFEICNEYSDNLPNKFYICRNMYYDYHI